MESKSGHTRNFFETDLPGYITRHRDKLYKKAEREIEKYFKDNKINRPNRADDRKFIKCEICGQPKEKKYCAMGGDVIMCYDCKREKTSAEESGKHENINTTLERVNKIEKS